MNQLPTACICCGAGAFLHRAVLWQELIDAWELSPNQAAYIDIQQGWHCIGCGNNLRAMALARAIIRACGGTEPLVDFVHSHRAENVRILEVNEAGALGTILERMPHHRIVRYPEVDLTALPFEAASFDIVCHSDTLEHVERPVDALRECRRVLARSGAVTYTVPIVSGRLTRRRDGMLPSYHGSPSTASADLMVQTEYGTDAWQQLFEAGFDECRIVALAPPAAYALTGIRTTVP